MKKENPSKISETWSQFCQNTYAPAFGFLIGESRFAKCFWISYILIGIGSVIYLTVNISNGWSAEQFYLTLDASSLEITQLDFPAIAICDINRISKRRAVQFAENLTKLITLPFDELLDLTRMIGNIYDNNIHQRNKFQRLEYVLNKYDNGTTEEAIIRRLVALMTPCQELLHNCSWDGKPYDCATLFETRFTDTGLCCMFNYRLETMERNITSGYNTKVFDPPKKFMGIGATSGLSMVVNNNISDYFYKSMATRGVLLKVFSPKDYPDAACGSLRQVIVQEQADVFVDVEATVLTTDEALKSRAVKTLCRYTDSLTTYYGGFSTSNCLMTCRVQGIMEYCKCAPVLPPTSMTGNFSGLRFCNVLDIPCLNAHEVRFHTYHYSKNPNSVLQRSLQREIALYCPLCSGNCNEVTYGIDANYFEFFNQDSRYRNSSRIHVFTNRAYTNSYRKLEMVTWYEALSTFGGFVSIFLGFSIMNVIEFGLFLLKLGYAVFQRICS